MNPFDQGARYATRRLDQAGMLRWLVGETIWSAWRWKGWLDSQNVPFPGEPDRRCDTVAWFDRPRGDAPPLAVVVEFMSRPRREVLERLTEYAQGIRRERPLQREPLVKFDVIAVLVNLTGEMASGQWGMKPPDTGGLGLSDRVELRNLSTLSVHDLFAAVKAGTVSQSVLAWGPLLAGANDPEAAREWGRLAGAVTDQRLCADLGGLARVFVDLADRQRSWRPVLEGWAVERSAFVDEMEGRGRLQATRTCLELVLRTRLRCRELPVELMEVIGREMDRGTLNRWLVEAATVETMAQTRVLLGLPAQ
jgi:hypothetical protein